MAAVVVPAQAMAAARVVVLLAQAMAAAMVVVIAKRARSAAKVGTSSAALVCRALSAKAMPSSAQLLASNTNATANCLMIKVTNLSFTKKRRIKKEIKPRI